MKGFLRIVVDAYIIAKVAPIIIGGAIVLVETAMNGLDNTIELLKENRILKDSKEKA